MSGTDDKHRRGGKRSGAGRPAEVKHPCQKTVSLDLATIERAREIGDGNISAGIRRAVASFYSDKRSGANAQVVPPVRG